jgi:hypothetical protein
MLARAARSYLSVRRAAGFSLRQVSLHLRSFAAYSDARAQRCVTAQTAIEWARQVPHRGNPVVLHPLLDKLRCYFFNSTTIASTS